MKLYVVTEIVIISHQSDTSFDEPEYKYQLQCQWYFIDIARTKLFPIIT